MEILKLIGRHFPEKVIEKTDKMLKYSGSNLSGDVFLGGLAVLSVIFLILGIGLFFYGPIKSGFSELGGEISPNYPVEMGMVIYLISLGIAYFFLLAAIYSYFSFKAELRRNAIESVIPDFLALVSSNIRSGMSLEQAMWQAAKPEFGILATEIKLAIKDAFAGVPLDKALDNLEGRFSSPMFSRIIAMLKESIKTGGEVAVVLEKTADEARDVVIAKKEIRSFLLIYVIFLFFASTIGVPALLAVSDKMVGTLERTFSVSAPSADITQIVGFTISKPPFSEKEFFWFSLLTILITNFIASFIVSVAYTGSKRQAFRFFPFMVILSYAIFFIALGVVDYILMNIR